MKYLGNAFSLQMIEAPVTIAVEEVDPKEIPNTVYSVIFASLWGGFLILFPSG